ncbi:MAG: hypothetical protein ACLPN2_00805 [Terriglobales bacterium]
MSTRAMRVPAGTVIAVLGGFAEATEESAGGGVGVCANEFSETSIAVVSAMIL